jgi:phosphoserine phosphatase
MSDVNPGLALATSAQKFLASVLALRPQVAAFDCDGTLWDGDAGMLFFYWELERDLVPARFAGPIRQRYLDYQHGLVSEEDICGEMVTIHEGVPTEALYRAAQEFFAAQVEPLIFPEMLELVRRLKQQGCQLWAVSSTNEWVIRAGARRFGIPDENILAACVHSENGRATGRLRMVPTDTDKAVALKAALDRARAGATHLVDAAFGNSIHDAAMLELAAHPFCINANSELQQIAHPRGWPLYFPKTPAAPSPAS